MHSMCNRKKGKIKLVQDSHVLTIDLWTAIISDIPESSETLGDRRQCHFVCDYSIFSLPPLLMEITTIFHFKCLQALGQWQPWQLFSSHKHTLGVHISLHVKSPQQQGIFTCYMLRPGHLSTICLPLVLLFIVILAAFISEPSKGCNKGHWWISINNLRGTVLLFLPKKKKYLLWYKARTKRLGGIKTKRKAWAKTECGFEILCAGCTRLISLST